MAGPNSLHAAIARESMITHPPAAPHSLRGPSSLSSTARGILPARPAPPVLTAAAICLGILAVAVVSSPECLHWFAIPVFACGVVCCTDALCLFSDNGRHLFRPIPLLGAFGVYFFFVAPLLHVVSDYWFTSAPWAPKDVPEDWRPWLGLMAMINLAGLGVYRALRGPFTRLFVRTQSRVFRALDPRTAYTYAVPFLAITLSLQIYIYFRMGGISAYIGSFSRNANGRASDFDGFGWLFCIAAGFPNIVAIVGTILFQRYRGRMGTLRLTVSMAVMFALVLLFGGLAGSRGNIIYAIAYILGLVHLTIMPLPKKWVIGGALLGVGFMYVYGFYKVNPYLFSDPSEFLRTLVVSDSRGQLEHKSRRSMDALLLGDLGRSDVQAYLLYRMLHTSSSIEYAYGRTYIETAIDFIPYDISGYRLPSKLLYGTDAVYGPGTYSGARKSLQIYGLAGETMLNFGPFSAPMGFIVLAAVVGFAQALSLGLPTTDRRRYIVPLTSVGCIVVLACDLDNVIFFFLQHGLVPFLFIMLCSRSVARRAVDGPTVRHLDATRPSLATARGHL